MKTAAKAFLFVSLSVSLAFILPACATFIGTDVEGQVLKEGTNKPVPEALVVVRWAGSTAAFVESRSVCVHVESTTSDAQGNFHTKSWVAQSDMASFPFTQVAPVPTAYKPGYVYVRKQDNVIYLKTFTGGREGRFQALWRIISATGCDAAGRSQKNLYPLYKAIYEEAKPLATTDEEKQRLRLIREIAAGAWIAQDTNMTTRESKMLIEEHLRDHLQ